MNIIVAGQDRLAVAVADILSGSGHNVRIVENDHAHLESIPDYLSQRPNVSLTEADLSHGDTSSISGVEECDMFIAATRSDAVNGLVAMQAKVARQINEVIAVIVDTRLANTYEAFGIKTLNPDAAILGSVSTMLGIDTSISDRESDQTD